MNRHVWSKTLTKTDELYVKILNILQHGLRRAYVEVVKG